MRLPSIFGRKAAPVVASEVETERFFSTDMRANPDPRTVREFVNRRLAAAAPKLIAQPDGQGMDGMNLANVSAITDISQPNIPDALYGWYALQTFIGYQMCAVLAQHWMIDKACAGPAKDAIRHGYKIILPEDGPGDADKIKSEVVKADKAFNIKHEMKEYVRLGRVFGVRVALFRVDSPDPDYYKFPFNPDAVTEGSYRGISQIDPYWMMPQLDGASVNDPSSPDFYEPTWWTINGKLYHKSHLCIFRTSQPPDILKPSYQYGGIPIPQRVMERVYAAERTANEAPQLLMSKRLNVYSTDLAHVMANQDKFLEHMGNFAAFRDNFGQKIIDTDDKMEQFDTTLAGMRDLIDGQYELVCAASNYPVTKMLGKSPKGLGGNGEYEESNYHEELETVQEDDLTPLVNRHHLMVARSIIEPMFSLAPGSLTIEHEWNPLDTPDSKEVAEENYIKAQTDDLLSAAGAIDGEDIRDRVKREPNTGYTGIQGDAPPPPAEPVKANPGKAISLKDGPSAAP